MLQIVSENALTCGVPLVLGYDTETGIFPSETGMPDTGSRLRRQVAGTDLLGIDNPEECARKLIAHCYSDDYQAGYHASGTLRYLGKPAIPLLLEAIRKGPRHTRDRAVEALAWIAEPEAVSAMLEVFRDPDWDLAFRGAVDVGNRSRDSAEWTVSECYSRGKTRYGSLRMKDLHHYLIPALQDPHPQVRAMAAFVLGSREEHRAIESLFSLLSDNDPDARIEAAIAMGKMGDLRAADLMGKYLASRTEPEQTYVELNAGLVRNHEMADAALIVGKTGDPRAIPILAGMISRDYHSEKAMELIGLAGECAAGPLIDIFLDSDDKKIRLRAGNALAACRSPRAVPIFRTLIDNPDWEYQMVAVQGLAACRAVTEIPRIREKLNAEMALVRWDAAAALFELGVPDGTAIMIDAIRRIKTWQVCRYFAAIDGRDPAKIDLLLKILEKKDKRLDIWKAESLGVLTAIHNPAATDYAIRWLPVESQVLKKRALTTLETMHDPRAVEPLVSCLGDPDPEIVFRSIHLLGKCGDLRAIDPIVRLADNPNPRIRECVAKALGRIGDPHASPVLTRLLADSHSYVRQASALALATAGSTESVGPLLIVLSDNSMLVRRNAATALGQIRDTRAFLPLTERLKDPMPGVRSAAARALGMLGDGRASGYLIPLLDDRIGFVRAEAVRSLGMLCDETCILALEDVIKTDPGRDEWGVPVAVTAREVLAGIKNRGGTESDGMKKPGDSGNPHQD